ncbi:MAG TPA: SGNH/GDSL hydrolase family protein [Bryobacteraceae bacterium]|nr:SGNH/GDSL hydrolase family protein [Bryobacteraceae bacterium]
MKTTALVLASILFALLLSEAALRVFIGSSAGRPPAQPPPATAAPDKPLEVQDAARYIAAMPAAPGTDRQWFTEDPPPLPNRTAPAPERLARYNDYVRRGLFGPQGDYVWNRRFVETTYCTPSSVFQNYPDKIMVFDPPRDTPHPRFRFPPNATLASGLVTNQFGLRGPPITLAKPPKTIRIAFAGASTTVNNHNFLFSYPERVTGWLNRFAQANHFDVRFETLNSGREGLNSEDLDAIVRDELLPLDPDFTVYYEGSNQFPSATTMAAPYVAPRKQIDPNDPIDQHYVPDFLRNHLVLANLLDRAMNGFTSLGEPRKPRYGLKWPPGVSEQNPDVANPNLPLQLPTIVKNLDSIRSGMQSIGGQLVLCSFEWLAKEGLPLSPRRHENIYKQLNTVLWPLRYADIRRLADFQNLVFQRYASARGIPFIDVASALPQDPSLFIDAIHMTDTGERVKAWIVFQQLVPLIRKQLESGQLPRAPGSHSVPPPPSMAISEMPLRCGDAPAGELTRVDGVVSFDAIRLVPGKGHVTLGHPIQVITPLERWAYAASAPIHMPANLTGQPFIFLRARVVSGQIGVGILDHKSNTFQPERNVPPSPALVDIYVPVNDPARADELIIRNTAEGGVRSEMQIADVALVIAVKGRL